MLDSVTNFFVNGVITSEEEAYETARKIEEITGEKVNVFYNSTTSLKTMMSIAEKISLGLIGIYSAERHQNKKSVEVLKAGLKEWYTVQVDKAVHGIILADRVEACLNADPKASVRLILHSQGAHIGLIALKRLKTHKDRIQVINLGGMVEIPKQMACQVINLSNRQDPVPNWISRLSSRGREWIDLGNHHTKTWLGHGMEEYLRHKGVQALLKAPFTG